jgi:hypothetical protein
LLEQIFAERTPRVWRVVLCGPAVKWSRTNGEEDTWIKDVTARCCDGVDAKIGWHFCFGNAWGNDLISGAFPEGYQTVLPHFFDT